MSTILIEVSGGVITRVLSTDPEQRVVLVDWDEVEASGQDQRRVEAQTMDLQVLGCRHNIVPSSI